ncbi:LamG domain-containing protein [Roseomonas genomospecies 6]|uniref:Uncharacterized protein n=1 Tax=Roseomonas genomospecies 6 TaxID=214106 RepID=A0A9W7KR29_9PROT|nr:LamG domain-containing protein [Roseomonas genomospecies 6]KAA0678068.1 hypothetical protein DS843_21025 [Roseomonas genomospecies 6]
MSELDDALYRAARYNNGAYHPETNPYGHTGKGGTLANWVRSLRDGVSIYNGMAAMWNSINFVAERTAVASILQRCQELVAQITMGSTSALAFPALDKPLLSTGAVAQVYVYDTRLDDLAADGRRWNEPGRCSAMSYWHEAQGIYAGVKRDVPAVVAITALREQWYFHDALDLDPVTGAPRLWRASNPTGNGLVLCGSAAPITCVFALHGYIYIGSGMGLHVISLTGDWCDRYDNGGRRRRLGTFAARNTVLQEGAVIASAALPATAINSVHALVYPGAPLDAAGMPIPTVLVTTGAGAAVIHPTGQVVHITRSGGFGLGQLLPDGRLVLSLGTGGSLIEIGPVPYATQTDSAWVRDYAQANSLGGGAAYVLGPSTGLVSAMAPGACGTNQSLTLIAEDWGNPSASMTSVITPSYATGWMPGGGGIRLATLCDSDTGPVAAANVLADDGSATLGWVSGGGAVSSVAGEIQVTFAGNPIGAYKDFPTVPGKTYVVRARRRRGSAPTANINVYPGGVSSGAIATGTSTTSATPVEDSFQFVAIGPTTAIAIMFGGGAAAGQTVLLDDVKVDLAAPDRSHKGKGLIVNGTLQRNPVATGADVVAWSGFSASNYLEQPPSTDLDVGTGDLYHCGWVANLTTGYVLRRGHATTGPWYRLVYNGGGKYQFDISDGAGAAASVQSVSPATSSAYAFVCIVRRAATGNIELWVNGALEATAPAAAVGSLSNAAATLRYGLHQDGSGALHSGTALTMWRSGAYAPTSAQIRRMCEDERPLLADGAKCLLGGTSSAVASLDRDPLTGRLAVGTGDGVSVFAGLRRVAYYDADVLGATTSDTVRSVALRGGHMLIGTATEVGFVGDAVGGKEAIAAGGARPTLRPWLVTGRTTDATPTALGPRIAVGERETGTAIIIMKGRTYGASAAEDLTYHKRVDWYRNAGGNVMIRGSILPVSDDDETTASPCDCTFIADTASQTIAVQVTGKAGALIVWEGTLTVQRRSEETIYAAQ